MPYSISPMDYENLTPQDTSPSLGARCHPSGVRADEPLKWARKFRPQSEEEKLLAKFNTTEEAIDDSEAIDLQLGQGVYRDDPRFMRVRHLFHLDPALVPVVLAARA